MQVEMMRTSLSAHDEAGTRAMLDELDAGLRESTGDVRELLLHFRTRTNSEDIEAALQATLRKFEHQSGVRTTLTLRDQGLPLPPDLQIQVLHIVQEALSNVRKHARRPRLAGRAAAAAVAHRGARRRPRLRNRRRSAGRNPCRPAHHAGAGGAHRRADRSILDPRKKVRR